MCIIRVSEKVYINMIKSNFDILKKFRIFLLKNSKYGHFCLKIGIFA